MEKHEQMAVVAWANYQPLIRGYLMASANGGYRRPAEARGLKLQGVLKGVSDLFFARARGGYHGLWIEMKTKKGKASLEQIAFIERMIAEKYAAVIAYGAEEAITCLKSYMSLPISISEVVEENNNV